jgi:hypothetical protein
MNRILATLAALLFSVSAFALTPAQTATLKAALLAEPGIASCVTAGDDQCVADFANAPTAFVVWRTSVSEDEYTGDASSEASNWSWPAYIARSVGERDGWARMFRGGSINPGKANIRQGIADIFSGTANNAAGQRAHLLAISKRAATWAESKLSSGTGTNATPAVLGWEGTISPGEAGSILRN